MTAENGVPKEVRDESRKKMDAAGDMVDKLVEMARSPEDKEQERLRNAIRTKPIGSVYEARVAERDAAAAEKAAKPLSENPAEAFKQLAEQGAAIKDSGEGTADVETGGGTATDNADTAVAEAQQPPQVKTEIKEVEEQVPATAEDLFAMPKTNLIAHLAEFASIRPEDPEEKMRSSRQRVLLALRHDILHLFNSAGLNSSKVRTEYFNSPNTPISALTDNIISKLIGQFDEYVAENRAGDRSDINFSTADVVAVVARVLKPVGGGGADPQGGEAFFNTECRSVAENLNKGLSQYLDTVAKFDGMSFANSKQIIEKSVQIALDRAYANNLTFKDIDQLKKEGSTYLVAALTKVAKGEATVTNTDDFVKVVRAIIDSDGNLKTEAARKSARDIFGAMSANALNELVGAMPTKTVVKQVEVETSIEADLETALKAQGSNPDAEVPKSADGDPETPPADTPPDDAPQAETPPADTPPVADAPPAGTLPGAESDEAKAAKAAAEVLKKEEFLKKLSIFKKNLRDAFLTDEIESLKDDDQRKIEALAIIKAAEAALDQAVTGYADVNVKKSDDVGQPYSLREIRLQVSKAIWDAQDESTKQDVSKYSKRMSQIMDAVFGPDSRIKDRTEGIFDPKSGKILRPTAETDKKLYKQLADGLKVPQTEQEKANGRWARFQRAVRSVFKGEKPPSDPKSGEKAVATAVAAETTPVPPEATEQQAPESNADYKKDMDLAWIGGAAQEQYRAAATLLKQDDTANLPDDSELKKSITQNREAARKLRNLVQDKTSVEELSDEELTEIRSLADQLKIGKNEAAQQDKDTEKKAEIQIFTDEIDAATEDVKKSNLPDKKKQALINFLVGLGAAATTGTISYFGTKYGLGGMPISTFLTSVVFTARVFVDGNFSSDGQANLMEQGGKVLKNKDNKAASLFGSVIESTARTLGTWQNKGYLTSALAGALLGTIGGGLMNRAVLEGEAPASSEAAQQSDSPLPPPGAQSEPPMHSGDQSNSPLPPPAQAGEQSRVYLPHVASNEQHTTFLPIVGESGSDPAANVSAVEPPARPGDQADGYWPRSSAEPAKQYSVHLPLVASDSDFADAGGKVPEHVAPASKDPAAGDTNLPATLAVTPEAGAGLSTPETTTLQENSYWDYAHDVVDSTIADTPDADISSVQLDRPLQEGLPQNDLSTNTAKNIARILTETLGGIEYPWDQIGSGAQLTVVDAVNLDHLSEIKGAVAFTLPESAMTQVVKDLADVLKGQSSLSADFQQLLKDLAYGLTPDSDVGRQAELRFSKFPGTPINQNQLELFKAYLRTIL